MNKQRKRRNAHALNPIMQKGGAHEKSKGAKRAASKQTTKKLVDEW